MKRYRNLVGMCTAVLGITGGMSLAADTYIDGNLTVTGSVRQVVSGSASYFLGDTGIGTANPQAKLEVSKSTGAALRLSSSYNGSAWTANQSASAVAFYSADASGAGAGVRASMHMRPENTTGSRYAMTFHTSSDTANEVEAMRITSAGYVGIGTNAPTQLLHVFNRQATGGSYIMIEAKADREPGFYLKNPAAEWFIYGTKGGDFELYRGGSRLRGLRNGGMFIPTGNFFVNNSLAVGMGTNAPTATLQVNGTGWFEQGITYVKPLGDLSMGSFTNR